MTLSPAGLPPPVDAELVTEPAGELERLDLTKVLDDPRRAQLRAAYERVLQFLRAAKADSTLKAYEQGWAHFVGWCDLYDLQPMPAAPETVALYLGDQADQWKWATIAGRLSAIAHFHEDAGHPSPTGHPAIQRLRAGIRRTLGTETEGKEAVRYDHLTAMIAAVRADVSRQPLARVRDVALLLLGAFTGLRRSNLVAIQLNHVTLVDGKGLRLHIPRSKTDQDGRGQDIGVPYNQADPNMCPVRAVLAWCDAAGVTRLLGRRNDQAADMSLFRGLTKHHTIRTGPLSDRVVALVVKDAIARAGLALDIEDFSAHSLRHGLVTEGLAAGADAITVMRTTGHRDAGTLRGYNNPGLFEATAAAAIYAANTPANDETED